MKREPDIIPHPQSKHQRQVNAGAGNYFIVIIKIIFIVQEKTISSTQ